MQQELGDIQYFFNGQLFLDYLDYEEFKKTVRVDTGIAAVSEEEFSQFYHRAIVECGNKRRIDEIFFENILYGRLTNIFLHKINNGFLQEEVFIQKVKNLIEIWNDGSHLPQAIKDLMIPESGFYLMDKVLYTKVNTKFIAGFDYETHNGLVEKARFLVVKVVPVASGQDVKNRYLITGIEIDYREKLFCLYVKNLQNHMVDDEDGDNETRTVLKTHTYYYDIFKNIFGLDVKINTEEDRKGMFTLCKELTDSMLEEVKNNVLEKVADTNKVVVEKLVESLFPAAYQRLVDKDDLQSRFLSTLIAVYIQVMLENQEHIDIAKDRNLIGYPTKVSFKKENFSQGSTGSSGANSPVASQVMFHSLHTDFEEALQLPKWAISWFRDIEHNTDSCEVAQTSITCKSNHFHVIFKNSKYIGKELLNHVIRELNKYRNY